MWNFIYYVCIRLDDIFASIFHQTCFVKYTVLLLQKDHRNSHGVLTVSLMQILYCVCIPPANIVFMIIGLIGHVITVD